MLTNIASAVAGFILAALYYTAKGLYLAISWPIRIILVALMLALRGIVEALLWAIVAPLATIYGGRMRREERENAEATQSRS